MIRGQQPDQRREILEQVFWAPLQAFSKIVDFSKDYHGKGTELVEPRHRYMQRCHGLVVNQANVDTYRRMGGMHE